MAIFGPELIGVFEELLMTLYSACLGDDDPRYQIFDSGEVKMNPQMTTAQRYTPSLHYSLEVG